MKLFVMAAVSVITLAAQDVDFAAKVKAGEGWGTSAISSSEIMRCWATWSVLREQIATNGRGSFPADYTVAALDARIGDWDRAVTAAYAEGPAYYRTNDAKSAFEKVRAGGLASAAEWSGACKKLPKGITPAPVQVATKAAPPAPASAGETAITWRDRGRAYEKGQGVAKDAQQAIFWTRKAAEAGDALAQYRLAVYHYNGFGGLSQDESEVMKWMRRSAESGDATAQDNIGLAYYQGSSGYPKNLAESARWFRRAAEQGDAQGQVDYGTNLWHGEGVAQNHDEAVRWFRKSAEQGNEEGQFWLGNAYRRGMGIEFDVAQARFWLGKSAAQGNDSAKGLLKFMDEVDREFAQLQRAQGNRIYAGGMQNRSSSAPTGNSLWKQAQETMERQRRENCAAAAQGRNRVCTPY